jgi:hypothetical protein
MKAEQMLRRIQKLEAEIDELQRRYNIETWTEVMDFEKAAGRNRRIGNHWFEPEAMSFFSTKLIGVLRVCRDGHLFITSERTPRDRVRQYSVRLLAKDGSVDTLGGFHAHVTRAAAERALKLHMTQGGGK